MGWKWLKGRHFSKSCVTRVPDVLLDGSSTCSYRILQKNGDMTRVVTYFFFIQTTKIGCLGVFTTHTGKWMGEKRGAMLE